MLYALPPNSNCVSCEHFRQNSMNKETIVGNNSSQSLDSMPSTQSVLSLRLISPSDSPLKPCQGSVTHQNPPFHPIINIPGFTCLREPRVLMTPAARYWWMCISKQDRWVLAKLHSTAGPFVTAAASGAGELNFSNHSDALHSMWGTAQACARCIPTCLAWIQTPFQNICPQLCLGLFTLEEYISWTTREHRVWQIHWAHEIWAQARCI